MKILLCPLNWGLGHATRCIPLIRDFLANGHEVVIVCDGFPLQLLQSEFPSLRFIEYPSYPVSYSAGNSQVGAILRSFPGIVAGIVREYFWLKKLLGEEHFDQVISDNRFGMWSRKVHSIYITHQLMVKMPAKLKFMEPLIWRFHRFFVGKYDECWIPDREGEKNLSGDLSHKYSLSPNARFIGPLSRFIGSDHRVANAKYPIVAIISGVEPQRSLFEEQVAREYAQSKEPVLIVCGRPGSKNEFRQAGTLTFVSHLPAEELAAFLLGAKEIICRSGYTTIMDLDALGCLHKATFVPTPGQTEQEYLFSIHQRQ